MSISSVSFLGLFLFFLFTVNCVGADDIFHDNKCPSMNIVQKRDDIDKLRYCDWKLRKDNKVITCFASQYSYLAPASISFIKVGYDEGSIWQIRVILGVANPEIKSQYYRDYTLNYGGSNFGGYKVGENVVSGELRAINRKPPENRTSDIEPYTFEALDDYVDSKQLLDMLKTGFKLTIDAPNFPDNSEPTFTTSWPRDRTCTVSQYLENN